MQQLYYTLVRPRNQNGIFLTAPDFDAEYDTVLGEEVSLQILNGKLYSIIIQRSYSDINL